MSSLYRSAIDDVTQESPKLTRAVRSRTWWPGRRESAACSNTAIRVSAHSRLPNSSGLFVALASVGPAERLRAVVGVGELVGGHLEVDLEAGVARVRHHRVLTHAQLVGALDVQLVRLAAQPAERIVEREVARVLDHVGHREVALAERRQRAAQHDLQSGGAGRDAPEVEHRVELVVHPREAVVGQFLRVEVELEVERADLGGVRVTGQLGEQPHRPGRRLPRAVDDEHLLLGADPRDAGLEAPVAQHQLHRLQVAQHPAHRGAAGRPCLGRSAAPSPSSLFRWARHPTRSLR